MHIGVDTGGTFTDLVLMDELGRVATTKASTTPGRLQDGVLDGLGLLAAERGEALEELLAQVSTLGYGTTQTTNALVERKGARTALITTAGFGDTLLVQRLMGYAAGVPSERLGHISRQRYPIPLVPRSQTREVRERVDHSGRVLLELDEAGARKAIGELIDQGTEAIAVCLLWSFRNEGHERRIAELIAEVAGSDLHVSLSCVVAPVLGEYERTAATVINAYLGHAAQDHFRDLDHVLRKHGFTGVFRVLNSIGGVMSASEAGHRPVMLLTSGPTGGVTGSSFLARRLGHRNVITTDMGGTTFDVGLVIEGKPVISTLNEVGRYHVSIPMVDIVPVGAGGGSIVSVTDGLIRVGPESAGAKPGPVSYDCGGDRVTVTDADLVLGIIDGENFLGGRMPLNQEAAEDAIRRQVADPLGISVLEAAGGVRQIVQTQMATTLREVTLGRGHDPRDFVLYAYGGAGPMHCAGYGHELGVREIIVPATSMVHSAYGALASDIHDSGARSVPMVSDISGKGFDSTVIEAEYRALEAQCLQRVKAQGVAEHHIELTRTIDMRYRMQTNELIIAAPSGRFDEEATGALAAQFEQAYELTYGRGSGYAPAGIEITTLRVEAVGSTVKPRMAKIAREPGPRRRREIYDVQMREMVSHEVVEWDSLSPGEQLIGPAVIEHPTTTVYVGSGQMASNDDYGNIVIIADVRRQAPSTVQEVSIG